jgi:hypothetical protein
MATSAVAPGAAPSVPRFPELVEDAIAAMWPAEVAVPMPVPSTGLVEEVSAGFHDLETIHANHARYNLDWAFEQARLRFAGFYDSATARYERTVGDASGGGPDERVDAVARRGLRALAWSSRVFSLLSILVSVVDIAISVVLILVISKISHYTDSMIGSATVALAVVALVALFKVTLDRFVILPMVHRWGWRRFGVALGRNKRILSNLLAVTHVVRELTSQARTGELAGVRRCFLARLRSCLSPAT